MNAADPATRHLQDVDQTVHADFESGIALRFFGFVRPYRLWLFGAAPFGVERACLDRRNIHGDPDMFYNLPPRMPTP